MFPPDFLRAGPNIESSWYTVLDIIGIFKVHLDPSNIPFQENINKSDVSVAIALHNIYSTMCDTVFAIQDKMAAIFQTIFANYFF